MAQMKEQIKTPEKELNEMEISNLSHAEFKMLVIRMFKELSEDFNSIHSETKDTLIEMKNSLHGSKSRVVSMIWNVRKPKANNQNNKKKKEF